MPSSAATPFSSPAGGSNAQLTSSGGRLAFACVRETAGAAATVRLFDGTDNTGALLMSFTLTAGESARDTLSFPVNVSTGVFAERVSGTTEIVAHLA